MNPRILAVAFIGLAAACSAVADPTSDDAATVGAKRGHAPPPVGSAAATGGPSTAVLDPLGPEFTALGTVGPSFTVDVPATTLGFSLDVPEADVVEVRSPDGRPFVTHSVVTGSHVPLPRISLPATSQTLTLTPGQWSVTLSNPSPVNLAHQRTSDGEFHGGVLDLVVYVPDGLHAEDFASGAIPGDVIDAASAPTHPAITARFDEFFALTKRLLDLDRGTVEFADVDGRFRRLPDQASQHEAHSVGATSNPARIGVRVLLTENLGEEYVRGFGPVAGGAFPNLPDNTVLVDVTYADAPFFSADFVEGARQAGITVATDFATTLLHETGHLWGLEHTSDYADAGGGSDALDDTPTCSPAMMEGDVTRCPDVTNLMFPSSSGTDDVALSPQQLRVVHGMAAYRPYAADTPSRSEGVTCR